MEEWNFRVEDACDGYVFGFLKYQPSASVIEQAGGHFQVGFWTIDPETRQRWLVGLYNNATLVYEADRATAHHAFKTKHVYDRRIADLPAVLTPSEREQAKKKVLTSINGGRLNFKCPVKEVEILSAPIALGRKFKSKHISERFGKPTLLPKVIVPAEFNNASPQTKASSRRSNAPLAEDGYPRLSPESRITIIPKHNILSNQFASWLREHFKDVVQENGRVDVEFRDGREFCRAELKICNGMEPRKAIREAVGQLLEYNFYGNRVRAGRWFIVLDEGPSHLDIVYLRRLVREMKMPLTVCWRKGASFQIQYL